MHRMYIMSMVRCYRVDGHTCATRYHLPGTDLVGACRNRKLFIDTQYNNMYSYLFYKVYGRNEML